MTIALAAAQVLLLKMLQVAPAPQTAADHLQLLQGLLAAALLHCVA
jgi:hypothetical protein